jgi:ATP-dependent Clp protease protease subunit
VFVNKEAMVDIFALNTGQEKEKVKKDMDRLFYITPEQAVEYGLIDRVFESKAQLDSESAAPAGVL